MQPISKLAQSLAGRNPLPAGAVPLAEDAPGSVICLMPNGRWIRWWPGTRSMESMPPETQRAVMEVVIGQLGGTAATVGATLDVSPRTVEAWRSGKAPLPIKTAYAIAEALAAL